VLRPRTSTWNDENEWSCAARPAHVCRLATASARVVFRRVSGPPQTLLSLCAQYVADGDPRPRRLNFSNLLYSLELPTRPFLTPARHRRCLTSRQSAGHQLSIVARSLPAPGKPCRFPRGAERPPPSATGQYESPIRELLWPKTRHHREPLELGNARLRRPPERGDPQPVLGLRLLPPQGFDWRKEAA
jgi:hypothetical protein